MSIEESVTRFNDEFPSLVEEENQLTHQVFESVQKKLTELKPIIDIMRERGYYFTHPSLNDRLKTTNGMIIGRNIHDNSEIYTVSKNLHFVDKVNGYSGEVEDSVMLLEHFLKVCDIEFLSIGIAHIEGFLETALDSMSKRNEKKRQFIEHFTTQESGV